jgi:acyl-CoA hydrolase
VVALNSAIEIDLSGQVCSDSIGSKVFSGSGGQLDFILGATYSNGGVPIIAMPSLTGKGKSKIVPTLPPGAGVVTPRTLTQWVVTEHGAVNLYGKSLRERARLLISIADPSQREQLERAFNNM